MMYGIQTRHVKSMRDLHTDKLLETVVLKGPKTRENWNNSLIDGKVQNYTIK